jgi:hypothetical protein
MFNSIFKNYLLYIIFNASACQQEKEKKKVLTTNSVMAANWRLSDGYGGYMADK